jgi:hypothetical protein
MEKLMNKYEYKIELFTSSNLKKEEIDSFLLYIKYKMDFNSVIPKKIEKALDKITENECEIIIKKFNLEDEI